MRKKLEIFSVIISILLLIGHSNAKGGRGGFSSRGGGFSRSGGSKSGGGFSFSFGGSKSSPSHSAPSYSAPSYTHNAPSYGWNVNRGSSNTQSNSPSYGWNVNSNTGSKNTGNTNYGWNVNNNNNKAPVGPPPAYPGLQNKPIPNNNNAPPAYSPSYHNPPAYNPSSYNNRPGNSYSNYPKNTYNSYSSNTGYAGYNPNNYGNTFGSHGLGGNTYISNNYYGNRGSGGSGFLTNALFYGAGMHSGYMWGRSSSYDSYGNNRRRWDEEEDRKWRATTQAPYFENKVPGEDKTLPASAVIGAATAFGLVSLLPLNVPANKPLMYCNNTDLMQSQIRINNENVYQCINNTIEISCSSYLENGTVAELQCVNRTMQCDLKEDDIIGNIYCTNGTLLSKSFVFCNSTTLLNGTNVNETTTILNCYEGQLPESQVAFIPTTTQQPATTTQKTLSFKAKAHIFLLKLIGKGDVLEKTTTPIPELPADAWIPEALTIPPETTESPAAPNETSTQFI